MENEKVINLNTFAEGALLQKTTKELQKVFENIHDPNTNPTKTRSITITISLSADEKREYIDSEVSVTSKLQPHKPATAKMIMGKHDGKITARELVSGKKDQMFFDTDEGVVKTDVGVPVDKVEQDEKQQVVAFKGAQ